MKYIDAEKLITKINEHINLMCPEMTAYAKARVDEAKDILNEITSLQQEQQECIYGRTLEEREKCCKFCSAICEVRVEQEQPGTELEKAAQYAYERLNLARYLKQKRKDL